MYSAAALVHPLGVLGALHPGAFGECSITWVSGAVNAGAS